MKVMKGVGGRFRGKCSTTKVEIEILIMNI